MADLFIRPFEAGDLHRFEARPEQARELALARSTIKDQAPFALGDAITLLAGERILAVGGAYARHMGGREVLIGWALVAADVPPRLLAAVVRHADRVLRTATVRVLITTLDGFAAAARTARRLGFVPAPQMHAPPGYSTWERLP